MILDDAPPPPNAMKIPRRARVHDALIPAGGAAAAACATWLAGAASPVGAAAIAGVGLGLAALRLAIGRHAATPPGGNRGAPVNGAWSGPAPLPLGVGREVLDRLPALLFLVDAEGRICFINAAGMGFGRDANARQLEGLHHSATFRNPAMLDAVARALTRDEASQFEFSQAHPAERHFRAHVRPISNPVSDRSPAPRPATNPAPAVLILLEDHTRIRRAKQLHRDFVANASHELKTPLASISGFIETLQGHAKTDPEAQQRFLRIMAGQAERMRLLVNDLLSLSRIEMNEHVAPRAQQNLSAIICEVATSLGPAAAGSSRIEVTLPADAPMVPGDREELTQVFVNLIDNAIKYASADAPVRVHLATGDARRAGLIGVTVADSGEGVAREHIPRLTERFYRINTPSSRVKGGTGLGLAIVKHIVNRHRGELTIESETGVGSRFTVWLPITSDAPPTNID